MAIVRMTGKAGEMAKRSGLSPAKKAAGKHALKKHAGKKAAGKKAAGKKAAGKKAAGKKAPGKKVPGKNVAGKSAVEQKANDAVDLTRAFHHLNRASALISLLEGESGGDLKQLLQHGIELYRTASGEGKNEVHTRDAVKCATELLRAAEHLAMAGLYSARSDFRTKVAAPDTEKVKEHLKNLAPRLERLRRPEKVQAQRLLAMAKELLRRASQTDGKDPHLDYELTMAADGLCSALEEGL